MTTDTNETGPQRPEPRRSVSKRRMAFAAALVLGCGLGAGATALAQRGHKTVLVALDPAPVSQMKDGNEVAVKGQVAEIFGNKFILADESGRALIETGRAGESGTLVAKSDTVTVQGRFEHGFLHAAAIRFGDGRSVALTPPPGPPPHPPHWPLG